MQIPAYCIATISTKLTGKCIATTPCISTVEIRWDNKYPEPSASHVTNGSFERWRGTSSGTTHSINLSHDANE